MGFFFLHTSHNHYHFAGYKHARAKKKKGSNNKPSKEGGGGNMTFKKCKCIRKRMRLSRALRDYLVQTCDSDEELRVYCWIRIELANAALNPLQILYQRIKFTLHTLLL